MSDAYYLTPNESALALVATAMKKSRLRFDTLVLNSIVGGVLFSAGGMLHIVSQTESLRESPNYAALHLSQGLLYPIGLFFVVIMGSELFNLNVLFFTVGLCRRAVGILDLVISWFISWTFNFAGSLFVAYVICYLGGTFREEPLKQASIEIMIEKAKPSFIEVFIRGIACNFLVSVAIYLQIMCKPLHVKFIMMMLPVFTFVSLGFNHTVADMFLCPLGLMNSAPVPVGVYVWKVLIPETLGNIVGGLAFGVVIPFYCHLVVVERDKAQLGLPQFSAKDEQPELMMDSRVVRPETQAAEIAENREAPSRQKTEETETSSSNNAEDYEVRPYSSAYEDIRLPAGVFPVRGMGEPLERERTIASGFSASAGADEDLKSILSRLTGRQTVGSENHVDARGEYLGNRLIKTLTRRKPSTTNDDVESQALASARHRNRLNTRSRLEDIPMSQLQAWSSATRHQQQGESSNDT